MPRQIGSWGKAVAKSKAPKGKVGHLIIMIGVPRPMKGKPGAKPAKRGSKKR